jgi:hypothetical protein
VYPQFPGLVLPSGQELTLGVPTIITLEAAPSRAYAPFPALLPIFNFIPEVVFCEGGHVSAEVPLLQLS